MKLFTQQIRYNVWAEIHKIRDNVYANVLDNVMDNVNDNVWANVSANVLDVVDVVEQ